MWLRILAKLPLFVLYWLANFIYGLGYHVIGYRKNVVLNNLTNSFPEKSRTEILKIRKQFYKNLAQLMVEVIKGNSISKKQLLKRVTFVNPELLQKYADSNQQVMLMLTHSCNWEWLLLASCAKFNYPIAALYKPLHNKTVNDFMFATRTRFGAHLIPSQNAIMEIMRNRKQLKIIAAIADQAPQQFDEIFWAKCLNQDTSFFVGVEKMIKLFQCPALFVSMQRKKRGHYQVTFKELGTPPYDKAGYPITEKYSQEFERELTDAPSDWLWSNRKWKRKKPVYS